MERKKTKINKKWTLGEIGKSSVMSLFRTQSMAEEPDKITAPITVEKPIKPALHSRKNDWANNEELQSVDVIDVAVETSIVTERDNAYLKGYINKVFNLSSDESLNIWRKVQKRMEEPDLKLSCVVVKADVTVDNKGTQEWYCNLGILHSQQLQNPIVQSKNLADWKKEDLIKEMLTTSQQPDLRWDDRIELKLLKPADEYLVIEIWNQDKLHRGDPAGGKGLKKIGNIFKSKESTFVGRIFYCLKPLTSEIVTKTLDLYSHSTKHKRGKLELLLSISGSDADKGSISGRLKEHRTLVTKIVVHESQEDARRKGGGESDLLPWDAQMDPAAESLIKFHAQFRSLSDFHQIVIRFSVLFSYHKANTLEMSVLTSLVDSISKLSLSSHPSDSAERTLHTQLYDELHEFLTTTLNILNNHLVDFDVKSSSSIESLKEHLILVKKMYSMEEFVNRLPSYLNSLTGVVESAIQNSAVSWYSMYSAPLSVVASNDLEENTEETVAALSGISKHILNECHAIMENMAGIFMTLFNIDYIANFFIALDGRFDQIGRLIKDLEAIKTSTDERLISSTYQMYVTFQELRELSRVAEKSFFGEQQLSLFHVWFKSYVVKWIEVASIKCKKGITEAIKNDTIAAVTEDVGYSSSLVDTMTLFHNMVVFWRRLKWPDPEEAYTCLSALIISITDAALYYVVEIYKRADRLFSKDGKFIATVQLSTILNNMQTIRDKLSPPEPQSDSLPEGEAAVAKTVGIIDELGLQDFFDWLEQERGIGLKLKEFVIRTMHNAADDINHKMQAVTEHLGEQFVPAIRTFLGDVLQTCGGAPSADDLQPLELYLNDNLQLLSANILYTTFKLVLRGIWVATIGILSELGTAHLKRPSCWQGYRQTVLYLKEYFAAGGDGLDKKDLETKEFKDFLVEVDLRSQPTNGLTLKCCSDLKAQQKIAQGMPANQQKLGELSISIGFLAPSSVIEVKVIAARNLPVERMCFKPYVELQLLPVALFEDDPKQVYKTSIHKQQTQNPCFGETFRILAHSSLMQIEGTILTLVTYDYDVFGKDNFIGLCVVPCSSIPYFQDTLELQKKPMELNLPLFHIRSSNVLQELVTRHQRSDEAASQLYTTLVKKFKANL